jgi:hypothetical protein
VRITAHTEYLAPDRARVVDRRGKRVVLPPSAKLVEFDLDAYGTIIRSWAHSLGGRVLDLSDSLYGCRLEVLPPLVDHRDPV